MVVTVLVTTALLAVGCGGKGSSDATGPSPAATVSAAAPSGSAFASPGATSATGKTARAKPAANAWGKPIGASGAIRAGNVSLVARSVVAKIKIYKTATGSAPIQTLANPIPSGGPLVFLVQERSGDRLRVLLPIRPNESQGWIQVADVKLSQLDFRITISAKVHQLRLYQAGKLVMSEPVGLGKGTTPTPGGVFYLEELLKPSNPKGAYGPYAYGLSGYSNVSHEFVGGDGQIGIHGTDDPSSVGKDVSPRVHPDAQRSHHQARQDAAARGSSPDDPLTRSRSSGRRSPI